MGTRKDRNDSTVAEVHVVVEATARWRFAARAGSSFRVMIILRQGDVAYDNADLARRPYSYFKMAHSNKLVEAVF